MARKLVKIDEAAPQSAQGEAPALNEREEAFAIEYLKDLNATQAAIRAGYDSTTAYQNGYLLLRKVGIAARINEERKKYAAEIHIERAEFLQMTLETYHKAMATTPELKFGKPTGMMVFDGKTAASCLTILGKVLGYIDSKTPDGAGDLADFGIQVNIYAAPKMVEDQRQAQLNVKAPPDKSNIITIEHED